MYRSKTSILTEQEIQAPKVMDFIVRVEQDRFDFDRLIRQLERTYQKAPLHIRYTIANDILNYVKYPGIPEKTIKMWLNAVLLLNIKNK